MAKPGRPPRPLPEGIGLFCDESIAAQEGMTRQGVKYLRDRYDIPPASEQHRRQWFERKGLPYSPLGDDF